MIKRIYKRIKDFISFKTKYDNRPINVILTNKQIYRDYTATFNNRIFPIYITEKSKLLLKEDILSDIELNLGLGYIGDEEFRSVKIPDITFTQLINDMSGEVELHIDFNIFLGKYIKVPNLSIETLTGINLYKGLIDNIIKIIYQHTTSGYNNEKGFEFYRITFHYNIICKSISIYEQRELRDFLYNTQFKFTIMEYLKKILKERNLNIKAGIPSVRFHNL